MKIFALEATLGAAPFNWSLFGINGTLNFTAGVLVWPFVFIMTDVINEYFGVRGVRFISWVAVGLICLRIPCRVRGHLAGARQVLGGHQRGHGCSRHPEGLTQIFRPGPVDHLRFHHCLLIGQLIDVVIFHRILKITGDRYVWLRATASTAVSQLLDSFIVLYIAFVIGPQHWSIPQFLAVGTVNYVYKMSAAIVLIPLLYIARGLIEKYLGHAEAERLRREAASD